MAGFEKPILHGLCTYGNIARCFSHQFKDHELHSVDINFLGHVFPGDTIEIGYSSVMGSDERVSIIYRASLNSSPVAHGTVVLVNSRRQEPLANSTKAASGFDLVNVIVSKVQNIPASEQAMISKKINSVAHFNVKDLGLVEIVFKDSKITVNRSETSKADFSFSIAKDEMLSLIGGKTTGRDLFMKGKIKISGDMMKSMIFDDFIKSLKKFNVQSKL
jgi:putative sterol carrier protein